MHELSSMVWCTYRAANNYAIVIHVHDNHVLIIAESSLHCTQGTLIPSNHALDSQTFETYAMSNKPYHTGWFPGYAPERCQVLQKFLHATRCSKRCSYLHCQRKPCLSCVRGC